MKPSYIIVGIAVVAIAGAAIALSTGPDLDAIIANKDCDAAKNLTDADVAGATAEQQLQIGALIGACLISGR